VIFRVFVTSHEYLHEFLIFIEHKLQFQKRTFSTNFLLHVKMCNRKFVLNVKCASLL